MRIPSNDPVECSEKCEDWESYIVKVDNYYSLQNRQSIKNAIVNYGPVIAAFDTGWNTGAIDGQASWLQIETGAWSMMDFVGEEVGCWRLEMEMATGNSILNIG